MAGKNPKSGSVTINGVVSLKVTTYDWSEKIAVEEDTGLSDGDFETHHTGISSASFTVNCNEDTAGGAAGRGPAVGDNGAFTLLDGVPVVESISGTCTVESVSAKKNLKGGNSYSMTCRVNGTWVRA